MPIIAVIGPSGAGKSTLVDMYLAEHPDAILHKSVTTRPMRDYSDTSHIFVTDARFDALEHAGKLLQPVSAYGFRYALPLLPDDASKTVFILIRVPFVPPFLKSYPSARVVQIEAPVEVLVNRLTSRGDAIERINTTALLTEIEVGAHLADSVVTTNYTLSSTYKDFTHSITTVLAAI